MTDTVERYTPKHDIPEDRFKLDISYATARLLDRLVTEHYEALDMSAEDAGQSISRAFVNQLREAMGTAPIPGDIGSRQSKWQRMGLPLDTVLMPERLPFEEVERRMQAALRATYGLPVE